MPATKHVLMQITMEVGGCNHAASAAIYYTIVDEKQSMGAGERVVVEWDPQSSGIAMPLCGG